MNCPKCGATNPDEAAWCGQCFARLRDERPATPVISASPTASEATPGTGAPTTLPAPPPPAGMEPSASTSGHSKQADGSPGAAQVNAGGGFRQVDGRIEWACVTCGEYNAIDVLECRVCQTPLGARYETDENKPSDEEWSKATIMGALLPGVGHIAIGRIGSGIARLLLLLVWLGGAIMLLGGGGTGSLVAAAPLLLGVAIVWVLSVRDLSAMRRGDSEILTGRPLLWLVVGVTVLLLLSAMTGIGGLNS